MAIIDGSLRIPHGEDLEIALRQQTRRNIQRLSTVARFDIVAYNPDAQLLQVWARKDGKNVVILSQVIALPDGRPISRPHFKDLVGLIGSVADLPVTSEEYRVPVPWWGYRFD